MGLLGRQLRFNVGRVGEVFNRLKKKNMNRIQYVKKFCTAEKEAIMLTEMGNNGYELCTKEGNAYYFKRAIEVKNLAQPDVSRQLLAQELLSQNEIKQGLGEETLPQWAIDLASNFC